MKTSSGRGPLGRAARELGRWYQKVSRYAKARTQPLYHRHAELLLPPQDFANAARRSQERDHSRPREPMLIHEMPDQFRRARRSARPLTLFIGSVTLIELLIALALLTVSFPSRQRRLGRR
jgi:hypothetical protein